MVPAVRPAAGGVQIPVQMPIGPYFADFCCPSARLVVEVDGPEHEEESDERKDTWLRASGYQVLRLSASYVYESIDNAVEAIYLELTSGLPPAAGDASVSAPPARLGRDLI